MPFRKAAKLSSIHASREALPDSDDEARPTEWVKSTLRLVQTDVRAAHRHGKKTRFIEEEEKIEVLSTPYSISSAQNENYGAWLDSQIQDETVLDDHDDYDTGGPPSGSDTNPDDDDASDESSTLDGDGGASTVHDLSEFAGEQRLRVRNNNVFIFTFTCSLQLSLI